VNYKEINIYLMPIYSVSRQFGIFILITTYSVANNNKIHQAFVAN